MNELKRTEDYLTGALPGEESMLFQSQLILDPVLRANVAIQKLLYKIAVDFGRRSTKRKIEELHQKLFTDPANTVFQETIYREFKK